LNRTITKSKTLVERTIRDQLVLVPLKTGPARLDALYTLNEVAGFLWKAIDIASSEEDLIASLVSVYEIDDSLARADVKRILAELASIGAITLSP
jgi:hypothetical protein